MKIGLIGYYGCGNFGDELFAEIFKQRLAPHTVEVIPYSYGAKPLPKLDAFIIGGGELLVPQLFINTYWREDSIVQSNNNVRAYSIGMYEGKFTEETICKYSFFLEQLKSVSFRDPESLADYNRDFRFRNGTWCPDMIYAYQVKKSVTKLPNACGLTIWGYTLPDLKYYLKLIQLLNSFGLQVYLIPVVSASNVFSDYGRCLELKTYCNQRNVDVNIFHDLNPTDVAMNILRMEFMVSFKLHPALVAIMHKIPTLLFPGGNKQIRALNLLRAPEYIITQTTTNSFNTWREKIKLLLKRDNRQFSQLELLKEQSIFGLSNLRFNLEVHRELNPPK